MRMQVERQKQLEQHVISNCYSNETYTFMQGQKCEEFHYKNDYKLNILKAFFNDHAVKHISNYEKCWKGEEFAKIRSLDEMDRAFLECHNKWIRNLRSNVSQELEGRVRELF